MSAPNVVIMMGSDSDYDIMKETGEVLKAFGVSFSVEVLSAHRSPDLVSEFAKGARDNGVKVVIAGAGGAAHLAGVVAAHTTLPVIGVPVAATSLNGFDSLLSTVQMPSGIPVATVAVGIAGARNAGILAVQILSLSDAGLAKKLAEFKVRLIEKVKEKNAKIKNL
ncbi:MAG: 5-(carboxyamino)imidazole ribonucleotide mutase [Candidatus Omnitrophota bacterium]|nr:5-(carboxyamino)imidazole ribonucleotide mutase [Candidatus Omnitrophota bacterium]